MKHARSLRNGSFIGLLVVILGVTQTPVYAAIGAALRDFCEDWEDHPSADGRFECTHCRRGGDIFPEWTANGSCDFSEIEEEWDMQQTSAAYIQESWAACDIDCGTPYQQHLAQWHQQNYPSTEYCYDKLILSGSWLTWSQVGGSAGPESTWSCDCDYEFWAECESASPR